jgi:hypothetical protein
MRRDTIHTRRRRPKGDKSGRRSEYLLDFLYLKLKTLLFNFSFLKLKALSKILSKLSILIKFSLIFLIESKNQELVPDQDTNGEPKPDLHALQNHNLLIALARHSSAANAQQFAMPVSIQIYFIFSKKKFFNFLI